MGATRKRANPVSSMMLVMRMGRPVVSRGYFKGIVRRKPREPLSPDPDQEMDRIVHGDPQGDGVDDRHRAP